MAAAGLSMSSLWETVPEISGAFETASPRAMCKNKKLSQANRGEKASPAPFPGASPLSVCHSFSPAPILAFR